MSITSARVGRGAECALVVNFKARAERLKRPVEEINREMAAEVPLGRYGTAEEAADLIVFLGSERASYITGTTIQIDGGLVRGIQ